MTGRQCAQLEHVVERTVVLSLNCHMSGRDIELPRVSEGPTPKDFRAAKSRAYVEELLASHRGNISRAAGAAGKNGGPFWN